MLGRVKKTYSHSFLGNVVDDELSGSSSVLDLDAVQLSTCCDGGTAVIHQSSLYDVHAFVWIFDCSSFLRCFGKNSFCRNCQYSIARSQCCTIVVCSRASAVSTVDKLVIATSALPKSDWTNILLDKVFLGENGEGCGNVSGLREGNRAVIRK